eukprot:scaffold80590_cov65-Phaeocystis_antarctica.AAC.5
MERLCTSLSFCFCPLDTLSSSSISIESAATSSGAPRSASSACLAMLSSSEWASWSELVRSAAFFLKSITCNVKAP